MLSAEAQSVSCVAGLWKLLRSLAWGSPGLECDQEGNRGLAELLPARFRSLLSVLIYSVACLGNAAALR